MDKTVTEIQDRMRDADEIAEAISSTNYSGVEIDPVSTYIYVLPSSFFSSHASQDELKNELEELEQQKLDDVLAEADHTPVHLPAAPKTAPPASTCLPIPLLLPRFIHL